MTIREERSMPPAIFGFVEAGRPDGPRGRDGLGGVGEVVILTFLSNLLIT